MSLAVLTFLVLCGFSFQHQAVADCGAETSDLWKDDTDSDEGTCTQASINNDRKEDPFENDPIIRQSKKKVENNDSMNSEVQLPLFQNIIKIFKFIWLVLSVWMNWK
uniref:BG642167 n=3 Tax=Drosophila melanogaster TaxID=7227 RepID=Q3HKQ1_DROME|eukprot:NP_001036758.1 BG642167 [Drosophila melanogaster]